MPTAPPTISAPPTAPSRADTSTFVARADGWVAWLESEATDIGTAAQAAYTNAVEAQASASAAATAAATAGAALWVSGTTYAIGDVRKSPATGLAYRRLTAGAGTTDPSADTTNWVLGVAAAPQLIEVTGTTQALQAWAHYFFTNAAQTIGTLPAAPAAGDIIWVTVGNGRVDNQLARNAKNIMGTADDLQLVNKYGTYMLRYLNASLGWWIVNVA